MADAEGVSVHIIIALFWRHSASCLHGGAQDAGLARARERIVLGDDGIGMRGERPILTNRRLIAFEGKGIVKPKYVKIQECPLDQIEEAWADVDGAGQCLFKITKDGEEWECSLNIHSGLLDISRPALGADVALTRQVVITNR